MKMRFRNWENCVQLKAIREVPMPINPCHPPQQHDLHHRFVLFILGKLIHCLARLPFRPLRLCVKLFAFGFRGLFFLLSANRCETSIN